MLFPSDALSVDDFHGVDLVGVVFEVPEVYLAVLALSQHFWRQNYLNFVSWEGNNFTSRF